MFKDNYTIENMGGKESPNMFEIGDKVKYDMLSAWPLQADKIYTISNIRERDRHLQFKELDPNSYFFPSLFKKIEEQFKVNDWVKYVGVTTEILSKNNLYRITRIHEVCFHINDSNGREWTVCRSSYNLFVKVPEEELFKVGGRALVREDLKEREFYGHIVWINEMGNRGKWKSIKIVTSNNNCRIEDGKDCLWTPEMFDQIEYPKETETFEYPYNIESKSGLLYISTKDKFKNIEIKGGETKFEVGDEIYSERDEKNFILKEVHEEPCGVESACSNCMGYFVYNHVFKNGKYKRYQCLKQCKVIKKGSKFVYKDIVNLIETIDKGETKMINKEIVERYPKTKDAVLVQKWFGDLFGGTGNEAKRQFYGIAIDLVKGFKEAILTKAKEFEKEEKKGKEEK